MASNVTSLIDHIPRRRDWTNDEVAELYRVEAALVQAGSELETDRGVTDEGDPWFTFSRLDGTVLVHIARFDGFYHLFSPALRYPLQGRSFEELTKGFVASVPLGSRALSQGVIPHPAALLSLLVVAIFFAFDELTGDGGEALAAPAEPPPSGGQASVSETAVALITRAFLAAGGRSSGHDEPLQLGTWATVHVAILAGLISPLSADAVAAPDAVSDLIMTSEGIDPHRDLERMEHDPRTTDEQNRALTISTDGTLHYPAPPDEAGAISLPGPPSLTQGHSMGRETTEKSYDKGREVIVSHTVLSVAEISHVDTPLEQDVTPRAPTRLNLQVKGSDTIVYADEPLSDVHISGEGHLNLLDIVGSEVSFTLAPETKLVLSLTFASSSGGEPSPQEATFVLQGNTELTLHALGTSRPEEPAEPVDLVLVSGGDEPNVVNIEDPVSKAIGHIAIVGAQDVALNGSAEALTKAQLDASQLQGRLTVGVDLGSVDTPSLLTFDGQIFVANENATIVLLNVESHSEISLGLDLQGLLVNMTEAEQDAERSLAIDLSQSVEIGVVSAVAAETLTIHANGLSGDANRVGVIEAPRMQCLLLTGDGDLSIGNIAGIGAHQTQNVVIDASELNGALSLDVGGILSAEARERSITVIGGAGNDVLADTSGNHTVTFVGNGGENIFKLAAGGASYTIDDLRSTDKVVVGTGEHSSTFFDVRELADVLQFQVDSETNLKGAAHTASEFAGSDSSNQAIQFMYQNESYVFLDADGDHAFDEPTDAIVHITGLGTQQDLHTVFTI
jgi:hypothetical protein